MKNAVEKILCGKVFVAIVAVVVMTFFSFHVEAQTQSHPFLLLNESMYQTLRDRQNSEPWATIKNKALAIYNGSSTINFSQAINTCSYLMRDMLDATALLYVIDPANKTAYKNRIVSYIDLWNEMKKHTAWMKKDNWDSEVPVGGAFFASIVAYDVIYNDLTDTERNTFDALFGQMGDDFYDGKFGTHQENQWGASATWYVFKNHARKTLAVTKYRERIFSCISDDGVYLSSVNYAQARLSSSSAFAKGHFMDIAEFTGEDHSYYSNPKMQKFYYWLFAHSITPNGLHTTIGDSRGNKAYVYPGIFKAAKFSNEVAEVAAWQVKAFGYAQAGSLVSYVLQDQPLPIPKSPESKIYPEGGAFFVEKNTTKTSLYGALWNPKKEFNNHSHKDVNAIHLNAYGEHIIRNSGYNGWAKSYSTFSWNNIANEAWTNNVVLVNGSDHLLKYGNGISEGFTSDKFDYACGETAQLTIRNGAHKRNLIMIHPQDNVNGYFLLFDEATSTSGNSKVQVLTHPNSTKANTVTDKTEYSWTIDALQQFTLGTKVNVFLGTESTSVTIKKGPLAATADSKVGEYIDAEYSTNNLGNCNVVTVIYPSDNTHTKAEMNRVNGSNYSGAEIVVNNDIKDYAVESNGAGIVNINIFSFQGVAALYRTGAGSNNFYFVRKGKSFNDGNPRRRGFESAADISIYLKDAIGKIISPGTNVKFYFPTIAAVKLNGQLQTAVTSGANWIEVNVPFGTHDVEYVYDPTDVKEEETIPLSFMLQQNYPNPFNPETVIKYQLSENNHVTLKVFDVLGREVATLIDEYKQAGSYSVMFRVNDSKSTFNTQRSTFSSGVYYYKLQAGKDFTVKKMLLMK